MDLDIEKLKESNEFLNTLYNNVTTAIFLADGDARIRHFNDPFQTLFCLPGDEILGALCGNAIGCIFQLEEGKDCGKTSHCDDCPLRQDIIKSFTRHVPVYKNTLSRQFSIGGRILQKHFSFSTKYAVYEGMEYVLVLVDDITGVEQARRLELERNRRIQEELRRNTEELSLATRDLASMNLRQEELTREVRHRVGNNLQLICSLLELDRHGSPDGRYPAIKRRIEALVAVYSSTTYEDETTRVRVTELVKRIAASFELDPARRLRVSEQTVLVSLERAVPLALVFEEILWVLLEACPEATGAARLDCGLILEETVLLLHLALESGEPPRPVNREPLFLAEGLLEQLGGSMRWDCGECASVLVRVPVI